MCCIPRDLPVARLAIDGIIKNISARTISVITRPDAFSESRRVLGKDVDLLDERELSGGMSLEQLRARTDIEGFPKRAPWYFQQLVKLGYALQGNSEDYYLIWDCDTILLRPLDFFSEDGRVFYTMAEERHPAYLDTYESLFGYRPEYNGSFISQHMVIHKAVAREMLSELTTLHPGNASWSWAIMNNLAPVRSPSLFSEYETYGNYVKSKYPETVALRHLAWSRDGAAYAGSTNPTSRQLDELSQKYYFAAFERWQLSRFTRIRQQIYNSFRRLCS